VCCLDDLEEPLAEKRKAKGKKEIAEMKTPAVSSIELVLNIDFEITLPLTTRILTLPLRSRQENLMVPSRDIPNS
jgi:hypothetical protein